MKKILLAITLIFGTTLSVNSQPAYTNPIIHADYSDPDVCQVGADYYLTASSFGCAPGLPILHSQDLVNWTIINYALPSLSPDIEFSTPQHGKGVWAPCIRHHGDTYYIYWGDPDRGIYCITTKDINSGKWSEPVLVKGGKGMIDPTPLWDDDGRVYLAHAWAGSRAGMNSIVTVCELDSTAMRVIGQPVIVFDGNDGTNHTIEGPKLYKRDGFYYIFAPAGGVATGWQLVMRSKDIYGPYEARRVMEQGNTNINGPHQGAWVTTDTGEDWFIHFQDKGAYGRVLHLNPMQWTDGWPVIGEDRDSDGCGEPVTKHRYPDTGGRLSGAQSFDDEFSGHTISNVWQWQANYQPTFGMPTANGTFRLYGWYQPEDSNSWMIPNMLLQKFMAEEFTATAHVTLTAKNDGQEGGLIVMGLDYFKVGAVKQGNDFQLVVTSCHDAENGGKEERTILTTTVPTRVYNNGLLDNSELYLWLRVEVKQNAQCQLYYSLDGKSYTKAGPAFAARQGKWIGAKLGFYATTPLANDRGWMDIDWLRVK